MGIPSVVIGDNTAMSFHAKHYLGVLAAALVLTAPAGAGGTDSHANSMDVDFTHTVTIGSTQLQAGHYTIKATETQNQITVWKGGKAVATVPCQWIKLPAK